MEEINKKKTTLQKIVVYCVANDLFIFCILSFYVGTTHEITKSQNTKKKNIFVQSTHPIRGKFHNATRFIFFIIIALSNLIVHTNKKKLSMNDSTMFNKVVN